MRTGWTLFGAVMSALLVMPAGCAWAQKVHEKEEIRKTVALADANNRQLVLDNINGSINVVGYDGDTIELVARKAIEAESAEKVEEAKRDVTLEIKQEPNKLILYVDAPSRTRDGIIDRGWHYYGYDVTYDFDLKVPRKLSLYLKTVNHGKVTVDGVEGEFEVRNVNGGIEMTNINGPASVVTVNGPVRVSFTKNPEGECKFKTINGKVEVTLHEGLNADLDFKTFNGHVYSDFDVTDLPRKPITVENRSGKRTVYRRGDSYSVRVGKGGPGFSFDTLNGSIYVLKAN